MRILSTLILAASTLLVGCADLRPGGPLVATDIAPVPETVFLPVLAPALDGASDGVAADEVGVLVEPDDPPGGPGPGQPGQPPGGPRLVTRQDSIDYVLSTPARVRITTADVYFSAPRGPGFVSVNGILEWDGNRLEVNTTWHGERTNADQSTEAVPLNPIPTRVYRQFASSLGEVITMMRGAWPQQNININSWHISELCGLYVGGIYDVMAYRQPPLSFIPGFPTNEYGAANDRMSFSKRNTACTPPTPPQCGGGGGGGPPGGDPEIPESMPHAGGEHERVEGCPGGGGGGGGGAPSGVWVTVCTGFHVYDAAGNFLYDEITECHSEYWAF